MLGRDLSGLSQSARETLLLESFLLSGTLGAETERLLLEEQTAFQQLMGSPTSERVARMRRFIDLGCQPREGERTLGADCEKLGPV